MKLFRLLFYSIILLVILSCSSSQESVKEEKLPPPEQIPTQIFSSHLEIKIPVGWREIKDNKDQLFEIWLVNDDDNAVIAFIPIYLTDELLLQNDEEKLTLIEKIVINKKKSSVDNLEIVSQRDGNNYQMSKSLRFLVDDEIHNSIIYGNGKNYYECLAYFSEKYSPDGEEIVSLIKTQEEIVSKSIIK